MTSMETVKRPRGRPRKEPVQPAEDSATALNYVDDPGAVADIVGIVASVAGLTPVQRIEVERRIRSAYGGTRIWIGRHGGDDHCERDERIRAAYRAGERAGFLARVYGLTQARIYQIIAA